MNAIACPENNEVERTDAGKFFHLFVNILKYSGRSKKLSEMKKYQKTRERYELFAFSLYHCF